MNDEVPDYDELPRLERLDLPYSWEFFGAGDQLGTLNHLTPEVVAAAARSIVSGVTVGLSLPVDEPNPPLFGREPIRHDHFEVDRNTWDDKIDNYFPQGSTQWDGFGHVRAREFGFYGGVLDTNDPEQTALGIEVWARRGIAGRGVLLDVAAHLGARGSSVPVDEEFVVTPELLEEIAAAEGVEVRRGDILLVRTGWPAAHAGRASDAPPVTRIPGIHAGEATARLLWNWGIAAIATDTPAVEPVPGDPAVGSLHRRLLPLLGIPLGELFDLERLSVACRDTGRYDFFVAAAPLNLSGAAGSPGNAIAIL
ncbi:cyclase family protein [Frondihabitans sucicola]|nr:cyclase family protein [Frondihabitans sucicola]